MMNSKGFTLLEMAIVILIIGFLSIPLFRSYDTYQYGKRIQVTRQNIIAIQNELSIFLVKEGRYPRPAVPGLAPGDVGFGLEISQAQASAIAVGTCGLADASLCRYEGNRDRDGDGARDPVLIGAVPIVTLADQTSFSYRNIPINTSLDGWRNKLTYAVSERLSSSGTFSPLDGVIQILDENGNPVGGINNDAHYTLFSHGKDAVGAYSAQGRRLTLCASGIYGDPDGPPATPTNPPGTLAKADIENCNANAIFTLGLNYAEADGPMHYDDILTFGKSSRAGLWAYQMQTTPTVAITKDIRNLNAGNVGIGRAPEVTLDVGGNIRAETRVRTTRICDADGVTNCFDTSILTGTPPPPSLAAEGNGLSPGIRCSPGRALVGISNGDEVCEDFALPSSGWTAQTCPAGRWLRGVRNDGVIECTN
jgi:prepilin-type N-terminal cleavage/methylation domain-containing protein